MRKMIVSMVMILALVFSVSAVLAQEPCEGNFDFDEDVDGTDAAVFKSDFGRSPFFNPCPTSPCPVTCKGTLSAGGRWCDQGNGTVRDLTTGLVWLKKADWGGQYDFWVSSSIATNAHDRAAQLWDGSPYEGSAGLSDGSVEGHWRLPTKIELYNLANGPEAVRNSSMQLFTGVQASDYWSSTTFEASSAYAWYVNLAVGYTGSDYKTYDYYVWPVRGGQ